MLIFLSFYFRQIIIKNYNHEKVFFGLSTIYEVRKNKYKIKDLYILEKSNFLLVQFEKKFNQDYSTPDSNNFYPSDHHSIIDALQQNEKCCGIENYKSWQNSHWFYNEVNDRKVPDSCCSSQFKYCGKNDAKWNIYRENYLGDDGGCLKKFREILIDQHFYVNSIFLFYFLTFVVMTGLAVFLKIRIGGFIYD